VNATPQRRWYQFSLKAMLVVVTVVCVGPLGYIAWEQEQCRKGEAAIAAVEKFDHIAFKELDGRYTFSDPSPRSAWQQNILGNDRFRRASVINILPSEISGISPSEKTRLAAIHVTDELMIHLSALTHLEYVDLTDGQVTDAGLIHLAGLANLKTLVLHKTRVTEAGVGELQKALPNCRISR
jgi:hypothetical protein